MKSLQILALAGFVGQCIAQVPDWHRPEMCTDGGCQNCPGRFDDAGPGFPTCNTYAVEQFADRYAPAPEGGLEVYFDIPQPDPECAFIVRSPAGNDYEDCGQNILTARNALCTRLVLRGTVMTQFCCGSGDCDAAGGGLPRSSIFGPGAGSRGLVMTDAEGRVIPPLESTYAPKRSKRTIEEPQARKRAGGSTLAKNSIVKRDCTFNPTGDVYTRTGQTVPVIVSARGPATIDQTESVSVGFSTSVEVGLNIEIFSAGVSFEVSEETTRSTTISIEVPDGQTGAVVWTATLQCQDGYLEGDDCSGEGYGCVGAVDGNGNFIGTTAFQVRA